MTFSSCLVTIISVIFISCFTSLDTGFITLSSNTDIMQVGREKIFALVEAPDSPPAESPKIPKWLVTKDIDLLAQYVKVNSPSQLKVGDQVSIFIPQTSDIFVLNIIKIIPYKDSSTLIFGNSTYNGNINISNNKVVLGTINNTTHIYTITNDKDNNYTILYRSKQPIIQKYGGPPAIDQRKKRPIIK